MRRALHPVHAFISSCCRPSFTQLQHNHTLEKWRDNNRCSHFLLCDSSAWDSHPPHSSHPSAKRHETMNSKALMETIELSPAMVDSDRWAEIVKGVDDTWLYVSEGTGGQAQNSLFQSLSVDMTPLPAVLKLLQHTPSSLFSPPHSLVLSDLVACR